MEGIVKKTIFRRAATSMLALIMALSYIPGIGLVYGEDKEVNKKIGEVIEITPEQQEMLKKGEATVSVLPTDDRWFGVTYHEDIPSVQESFKKLVEDGVYPAKLWN